MSIPVALVLVGVGAIAMLDIVLIVACGRYDRMVEEHECGQKERD